MIWAVLATALGGCLFDMTPKHLKPLSASAKKLLEDKGLKQGAALYVRIFKEESELEAWLQAPDGSYRLFKTYDICKWSGELGPKLKEGDRQAPEGFYVVRPAQMNPNSKYYLSFNIGYPNAYDTALRRTGKYLMVHGGCSSAGCYAVTDGAVEEIFALARDAFMGGQREFHVHAFPFRMTDEKLLAHKDSRWYAFWKNLKTGYDMFEENRRPPLVGVRRKRYVFFDPNSPLRKPDNTVMIASRRNVTPTEVLAAAGIDVGSLSARAAPQPDEAFLIEVSQGPDQEDDGNRHGNN